MNAHHINRLRVIGRRFLFTAGFGMLCWFGAAGAAAAPIEVSVATDKGQYRPGERLHVLVTARNTTDEDVVLQFVDGRQGYYVMDRTYHAPEAWILAATHAHVPAGGSHTWDLRHNWRSYSPGFGTHDVVGGVAGYGEAGPVQFEVVAPTPPTQSFLIDFDTVPGTNQPVYSMAEYWPFGVRFRSQYVRGGGGAVGEPMPGIYGLRDGMVHGTETPGLTGNRFVTVMSATYPPEVNIVADLEMPVYGATVDVSAVAGFGVTMIARDAQGEVLDTATSPPVARDFEFVGPISVSSDRPIASLEWWGSIPNGAVAIDNLFLDINPEPSSAVLIAMAAGAGLLARRRRRCSIRGSGW